MNTPWARNRRGLRRVTQPTIYLSICADGRSGALSIGGVGKHAELTQQGGSVEVDDFLADEPVGAECEDRTSGKLDWAMGRRDAYVLTLVGPCEGPLDDAHRFTALVGAFPLHPQVWECPKNGLSVRPELLAAAHDLTRRDDPQ